MHTTGGPAEGPGGQGWWVSLLTALESPGELDRLTLWRPHPRPITAAPLQVGPDPPSGLLILHTPLREATCCQGPSTSVRQLGLLLSVAGCRPHRLLRFLSKRKARTGAGSPRGANASISQADEKTLGLCVNLQGLSSPHATD